MNENMISIDAKSWVERPSTRLRCQKPLVKPVKEEKQTIKRKTRDDPRLHRST